VAKDPEKQREAGRKWYLGGASRDQRQVYALLDPASHRPRYIGKSLNAERRAQTHWQQRMRRHSPVAEWLRSLTSPPGVWVLQTVPVEQAAGAERYWIKLFAEIPSVSLLNICHGPVPGRRLGMKHSPEAIAKMRGRPHPGVTGTANHSAKLTEDDVRAIRSSGGSLRELARQYGVSWIAIRNVRLRRTWKHVQ
jgi:hypothetical protein